MAATIKRYNFPRVEDGTFATEVAGVPLSYLIGDTLAALITAEDSPIRQVRMQIGSDSVSVLRQYDRISVFVSNSLYSRRLEYGKTR